MKKAFTVLELIITLGIITIISLVIVPNTKFAKQETKEVTIAKNKDMVANMFNLKLARLRVGYKDKTTDELLNAVVQELSYDETLEKVVNPYNKKQRGIAFLDGDVYNNSNKLAYILTKAPKVETFPIGTLLIQLDSKTLESTFTTVGKTDFTENTSSIIPFPLTELQDITIGSNHTILLTKSGDVYVTGYNSYGQLGLGDTKDRTVFVKVNISNIKKIYAGVLNSFFINDKNEVFITGINRYWDEKNQTIYLPSYALPTKLPIENVEKVYSDRTDTTISIQTKTGEIYVKGYNGDYRMGTGTSINPTDFIKFTPPFPLSEIKDIKPSYYRTTILLKNGDVYSIGNANNGTLGITRSTLTGYTQIPINNVKDISIGQYHSIVLTNNDEVYTSGMNTWGQLGLSDSLNRYQYTKVNISNVKSVHAAHQGLYVLKNDGTVWGSGYNSHGQLGIGDTIERSTFTKMKIEGVQKLHTFANHVSLETVDGVYIVGYNGSGNIGIGNITNQTKPIKLRFKE